MAILTRVLVSQALRALDRTAGEFDIDIKNTPFVLVHQKAQVFQVQNNKEVR
jgi:hypothetical protein